MVRLIVVSSPSGPSTVAGISMSSLQAVMMSMRAGNSRENIFVYLFI